MRIRSSLQPAIVGLLLALLFVASCGGSGGGTGSPKNAVQVSWPTRSRSPLSVELTSALSARFTFSRPGGSGAPSILNVNRPTAPEAALATYPLPSDFDPAMTSLTVAFFSQADQAGTEVGGASASLQIVDGVPKLDTITLSGTVKSVVVVPAVLPVGGPPTQLEFTAKDGQGNILALSSGSATWTQVSGGVVMGLTTAGMATPKTAGTSKVTVAVDGVTSPEETIQVKTFDAQLEWVDITPTGFGNYLFIKIVKNDLIAGFRANYDSGGALIESSAGIFTPEVHNLPPLIELLGTDGTAAVGYRFEKDKGINSPRAVWVTPNYAQVDLHPVGSNPVGDGYNGSEALDVDGNTQVGFNTFTTDRFQYHAVLWRGSPGTLVDLHPIERFPAPAKIDDPAFPTQATHISGDLIAGFWGGGTANYHACAWTDGTRFSFREITPAGVFGSQVLDMENGIMVGEGGPPFGQRIPILWTGPTSGQAVLLPTKSGLGTAKSLAGNYAVGTDGIDQKLAIWNVASHKEVTIDAPEPPTGIGVFGVVGARKTAAGIDVVYLGTVNSIGQKIMVLKVPTNMLP